MTSILTVARAMALPYLVVYFSEAFGLDVTQIGLLIGFSLITSSVLGVYGGFLVDRFTNYHILVAAGTVFSLAFAAAYGLNSLLPFVIAIIVVNLSYSVVDIAVKSGIGALVSQSKRGRVFSAKYTLTNIGYAIGPFLGAYFATVSTGLPFAVAAVIGAVSMLLYWTMGRQIPRVASPKPSSTRFGRILIHMLRNYKLVCFTAGGILSAIVFGQFTAYISQYLIVTTNPKNTYEIVNYLVTTNACLVIGLQYLIGARITHRNLFRMLLAGMLCFVIGLLGFSYSMSPAAWIISMAIFTLGEIIVIPAEYLFIDHIAPEDMRGVYYGAQNLSSFGAALGPIICGFSLSMLAPQAMFYILCLCIAMAGLLYFTGSRHGGTA